MILLLKRLAFALKCERTFGGPLLNCLLLVVTATSLVLFFIFQAIVNRPSSCWLGHRRFSPSPALLPIFSAYSLSLPSAAPIIRPSRLAFTSFARPLGLNADVAHAACSVPFSRPLNARTILPIPPTTSRHQKRRRHLCLRPSFFFSGQSIARLSFHFLPLHVIGSFIAINQH